MTEEEYMALDSETKRRMLDFANATRRTRRADEAGLSYPSWVEYLKNLEDDCK